MSRSSKSSDPLTWSATVMSGVGQVLFSNFSSSSKMRAQVSPSSIDFDTWLDNMERICIPSKNEEKQIDDSMNDEIKQRQESFYVVRDSINDYDDDEDIARPFEVDSDENETETKHDNDGDDHLNLKEVKSNFAMMILDTLCINHSNVKKVDERYFCGLGDCKNTSKDGMEDMISRNKLSDSIVSQQVMDWFDECGNDGNDDNGARDDENDLLFSQILVKYMNRNEGKEKIGNGYVTNKEYLRATIDSIKCRIDVNALLSFDFGAGYEYQATASDLLALLLEICDETIHKKIISAAIEQQIPIPVLYCMSEVKVGQIKSKTKSKTKTKTKGEKHELGVDIDSYVRDTLHLSSQSKLIRDGMCQTELSRNKGLILFVGSNQVKGKSSMLKRIFDNVTFNVCEKATPLHDTSVDVIYLPDQYECNYHILDVHGRINDPYFNNCNPNCSSRMDYIASLASLAHCVVIQINISQLNDNIYSQKKRKDGLTFMELVSDQAHEIIKFYQRIKVSV